MPAETVWVDSVACFDALRRARLAARTDGAVTAARVGQVTADDALRALADAAAGAAAGVVASVADLADDATLTALRVLIADGT